MKMYYDFRSAKLLKFHEKAMIEKVRAGKIKKCTDLKTTAGLKRIDKLYKIHLVTAEYEGTDYYDHNGDKRRTVLYEPVDFKKLIWGIDRDAAPMTMQQFWVLDDLRWRYLTKGTLSEDALRKKRMLKGMKRLIDYGLVKKIGDRFTAVKPINRGRK